MASQSGTFTTAQQVSGLHLLYPGQVARTVLTITGSAAVQVQESIGPSQAARVITTLASSQTYDYRNQTDVPIYLRLLVASVSGSVAWSLADTQGDEILEEWYSSDGRRVAMVTDEGFVGPVLTPVAQGGAESLYNHLTPEEITAAQLGTSPPDISTAFAAMMAAAGVGGASVIPAGTYAMGNVSGSLSGQRFSTLGRVIIKKNANGAHFTHSGDNVVLDGLEFDGESASYSGHGVVLTGNRPWVRVSSYDQAGRAVLATGQRVIIEAAHNVIATADATSDGYDIQLGADAGSAEAMLYHQINGFVSTLGSGLGGVLVIDGGSHCIKGGQFGKYKVMAVQSPSGINSGFLDGARVLGPVSLGVSNGWFLPNSLGSSATVTFESGTTGLWAISPGSPSAAWTNSGNANNVMIRQTSAGSVVRLKVGPDSSAAYIEFDPSGSGKVTVPQLSIPNALGLFWRNAADDGNAGQAYASAANNLVRQSLTTGASLQDIVTATGQFQRVWGSIVAQGVGHKETTSITDAAATTVATISVPNSALGATIRVTVLGMLGAGGAVGAYEAVATNTYTIALARTAGANVVAAISGADGAAAANVAGANTVTAVLTLGAVSGAVGATNTIPIQATITKSGGSSANHRAMVIWDYMNAIASGVSVS